MSNNKQKTAVEWFIEQLNSKYGGNDFLITHINEIEKAKEMDNDRMIKLIQFVVSEKELVDYSSVSNETANYYLDKFNQEDKL
jgi:disulfide oxidoreductase YuzD